MNALNIKDKSLLTIFAICCISTFSSYLFVGVVGFCAIEVVLIPLLFLYPQFVHNVRQQDWVVMTMIIVTLLAVALISLTAEQSARLYSPLRSYVIFFVAFYLFYRNPAPDLKYVFYVAVISKVFDLLGAELNLAAQIMVEDKQVANGSNFLMTPILLAYAYYRKSTPFFVLMCALCLTAAFFTVTRGVLLYTFIDIGLCILLRIKSMGTLIKGTVIVAVLSIVAVNVYFLAEDTVRNYSLSMHNRLYTKVLDRENAHTGDDVRIGHMTYLWEHPDESLLPHGIPSRDATVTGMKENRMLWSVQDSSFVELMYTYGVFALFLCVLLAFMTYYHWKLRHSEYHYILAISLLNLIVCLPMGYGLFMFPPLLLTLGGILGVAYQSYRERTEIICIENE